MKKLSAPYPYFGGKSTIAPTIWEALGPCPNYVEPFMGSGAVLLARPHPPGLETVNDLDAHIPNFWRAMQRDPEGLARACDVPVFEVDQHAYHTWLIEPARHEAFVARLMGDPDYYDLTRAARWCAGLCMWIGGGWCSGEGPWQSVEGRLVKRETAEPGVQRNLVHLGNQGRGVKRRIVHLGDKGRGVKRRIVHLSKGEQGVHRQGVKRQRVALGGGGSQPGHGVHSQSARESGLADWFAALAQRLRYVRVCCGDWTRVLGPSVTWNHGVTGVFLDPPYSAAEGRYPRIYREESLTVAHAVAAWCLANGSNPLLRIVLCGYGDVHDELLSHGWRTVHWTANGGYGNQRKDGAYANKYRETLYVSPACPHTESERQLPLW
jgi:D12 class N6 adenine-specific DNA methyltransferase